MKSKQLHKLFLASPVTYRKVLITENQIKVVNWIRECGFTSVSAREFSEAWGLSVQNGSQQLTKLEQKGYLEKAERVCETGGIYYRYSVAV